MIIIHSNIASFFTYNSSVKTSLSRYILSTLSNGYFLSNDLVYYSYRLSCCYQRESFNSAVHYASLGNASAGPKSPLK